MISNSLSPLSLPPSLPQAYVHGHARGGETRLRHHHLFCDGCLQEQRCHAQRVFLVDQVGQQWVWPIGGREGGREGGGEHAGGALVVKGSEVLSACIVLAF